MPRATSYYSLYKTEGFVESNKCRIDAYYPNCSTFIFKVENGTFCFLNTRFRVNECGIIFLYTMIEDIEL